MCNQGDCRGTWGSTIWEFRLAILMVNVFHFSHCDKEPRETSFKVNCLFWIRVSEVTGHFVGPFDLGETALHIGKTAHFLQRNRKGLGVSVFL